MRSRMPVRYSLSAQEHTGSNQAKSVKGSRPEESARSSATACRQAGRAHIEDVPNCDQLRRDEIGQGGVVINLRGKRTVWPLGEGNPRAVLAGPARTITREVTACS